MLSSQQETLFYEDIGERIRLARKLKGINQEELANQVGISRVSLANMENGKQRVLVHVILEIADSLKVSVTELMPPLPSNTSSGIDAQTINRINKEIGRDPESVIKAIDFIKSYLEKVKK